MTGIGGHIAGSNKGQDSGKLEIWPRSRILDYRDLQSNTPELVNLDVSRVSLVSPDVSQGMAYHEVDNDG